MMKSISGIIQLATVHAGFLPEVFRLPAVPSEPLACPCEDVALCKTPTKQHARELFGFGEHNELDFDWTRVTTVANPHGGQVVCAAHKRGARVIGTPPSYLFTANETKRREWVENVVAATKANFFDGITFDYENPMDMTPGSATYQQQQQYIQIINETTQALHAAIPGSQVSVCVGWSPDDIDGRNYDARALAAVSDLLFIMVYDTRSQIFGKCIASANAPTSMLERGVTRYLQLGIPGEKLIVGTPWYGYQYPCQGAKPQDDICQLKLVPFRGVNCSDAAGSEVQFMDIMNLLDNGVCPPKTGTKCEVTTAVRWDTSTQSPYFNFVVDGKQVYQMWFDNATSSALKYQAAARLGVRGVGPYRWDYLDHNGSITGNSKAPAETASMWEALDQFSPLPHNNLPQELTI
eukprot:TRINITY_DN49311_c0_g1_i1.p1 TRINITY_DN49311_c0_g1~~TRINITY_DN49311_c0_g1_i1.p1  ORF type:complete len:407 (-),score=59.33 TRINITY_DN49311_c0_g1_i1:78-1298(-)